MYACMKKGDVSLIRVSVDTQGRGLAPSSCNRLVLTFPNLFKLLLLSADRKLQEDSPLILC